MAGRALMAAATIALWGHVVSAQSPQVMTWKVEGDARRAMVYGLAAKSAGGRAPLVFSFHGHGDKMQNFQYTDMHRAWPEAIVVYFQGLPSHRDGLAGWQTEKGEDNDRDLKLVDAALASLRGTYKIDDARIYATGFSNGATFTYLLWAERPDVFAAFAPVAARLRPSVRLKQPKPVFHIAGVQDRQIPYADQQDAIEAARSVNGTAAPVMTWIHVGGHEYPDSTSERIAKFFREHPSKP
jgi:polyhydroxybutyrate depolymerase